MACQNKECRILCKFSIVKSCKIVKQKNVVKQIYQKAWKNKARILSQEIFEIQNITYQIYAGLILFQSKKLSHIGSTHTSIFNTLLTVHVFWFFMQSSYNLHAIFMQSLGNLHTFSQQSHITLSITHQTFGTKILCLVKCITFKNLFTLEALIL